MTKPWFYFSQTRSHFNQNFKMNLTNLSKANIFFFLGVWALITLFQSILPKRLAKPQLLNPSIIFLQTRPHFNQKLNNNPKKLSEVEISFRLGIRALKTRLGLIGPKAFGKKLYKARVQNLSPNFHKHGPRLTRIIR